MARPAYVALPGLSTVSILLNLPYVSNLSSGPAPIIFIDEHDYKRLRGPPPLGDGQSAQKDHYLAMAYDDLRRRGIVRLIDYSEFYPAEIQKRRLQQNHKLVEDAPDWVIRQAAVQGIDQWVGYGRGEYQEGFRRSLGEDTDAFSGLRRSENQLRRKMKRGTGDPPEWIEKMLNKNIAALEVCRRAEQRTELDVRGVIASSEHRLSSDFLKAAKPGHEGLPTDIIEGDYDLDIDASYLQQLDPHQRIVGLDSTMVSGTREMLATVSKVATEIADVQHDDWTLFGLSFALPHYNSLFDFDTIRSQVVG